MRQWDTKRQFKPRYKLVAEIIFMGWLTAIRRIEWHCWVDDIKGVIEPPLVLSIALLMLLSSPITFPVACAFEYAYVRRRRLRYLRANRRADADV